ncbi:MAG: hypothetical protein A2Z90_11105 [Burkholderiales bacterium GWA2_64_37]|nr:MAG: hypothetical protein A2Z90_11105 [Burkholderiales bacterium GWA2_64_37]HCE94342.1 hypothetical protein [Acidovorax sp.]
METTEIDRNSFTHVLVGDVVAAQKRLEASDTQTHRRELIRAAFAAMEGLHWRLKRGILDHADMVTTLSAHERAALLEESYSVDHRGKVRAQPRFLTLPTAIRLVIRIVQRYRPNYEIDFNHAGWSNLQAAVEVRNRLVHPKALSDLNVSDNEGQQALSAFSWLLALVIEVQGETISHLKAIATEASAQSNAT